MMSVGRGEVLFQSSLGVDFESDGWKIGGDGQGCFRVTVDSLTLLHEHGGYALHHDLTLPHLAGTTSSYKFVARVRSDRPGGVFLAVYNLHDKAWSDSIRSLPTETDWHELSVVFKFGGDVRIHVWADNSACVSVEWAKLLAVDSIYAPPPVDATLLAQQKRPPYATDELWAEFCNRFIQSPIEAYALLRGFEIETNQEISHTWPRVIQFSLTDLCNIMCRFCGQTKFAEMFRSKGYSASDVTMVALERIFEKVQIGYPYVVDFAGDGEPLALENFKELVAFLRRRFPYSQMNLCTNGLALDRDTSEFLVDNRFNAINVSLNAATSDTWLKTTGNKNFDKVIENIKYLQTYKRTMGTGSPWIGMSYVATRVSVDDLPRFIILCTELDVKSAHVYHETVNYKEQYADFLVHEKAKANAIFSRISTMAKESGIHLTGAELFSDTHNDNSSVPAIQNIDFDAMQRDYIRAFKEAKRRNTPPAVRGPIVFDGRPMKETTQAQRCAYPWEYMLINGRGESRICCGAIPPEPGSILELGFAEMWNGVLRRYLRRTVNSARIDKSCFFCPLNLTRDVDDAQTHVRPQAWEELQVAQ